MTTHLPHSAVPARPPFLDLPPLLRAAGTIRLPGSKSISNRVLLLAALCSGTTRIDNLLHSDDTHVMIAALKQLGCSAIVEGETLVVDGLDGRLNEKRGRIFLGNSGTSMRSLTAALALLAARQGGLFEVGGVERMHERPIADLVDALLPLGCPIEHLGEPGFPPLRLGDGRPHALRLDQPIVVGGNVSSQFLTGLLLALPLVAQEQDVVVEVAGRLISVPYIGITLEWLRRFGVEVRNEGWRRFVIPAGSRLRSPGTVHVEGDASSASYFIALGAIAASAAAPLHIEGVGAASVQGDVRFAEAARAMGAKVQWHNNGVTVSRGLWPLRAIDMDCNAMPDAAMTLAVLALYAEGTTVVRNIASWRVKETDRIAAMTHELRKLGATVEATHDSIAVTAPAAVDWRPAAIATYDDHRIAMCFALAAFNALAGASPPVPVRILDPSCVGKTFPSYFDLLLSVAETDAAHMPVITIDGPTASGKGTVAGAVARALGYRFLDSGAVYRATALAALQDGIAATDEAALGRLAMSLDLRFDGGGIFLAGVEVGAALRDEAVGALASAISALPAVRSALVGRQLAFRGLPGLVADGRDMGTVIFPDADLKVFLTASAATRATRRHGQLISRGISASIIDLQKAMEERDSRDTTRAIAPLRPAGDALLLDNSDLSVDQAVRAVLAAWERRRPFAAKLSS